MLSNKENVEETNKQNPKERRDKDVDSAFRSIASINATFRRVLIYCFREIF